MPRETAPFSPGMPSRAGRPMKVCRPFPRTGVLAGVPVDSLGLAPSWDRSLPSSCGPAPPLAARPATPLTRRLRRVSFCSARSSARRASSSARPSSARRDAILAMVRWCNAPAGAVGSDDLRLAKIWWYSNTDWLFRSSCCWLSLLDSMPACVGLHPAPVTVGLLCPRSCRGGGGGGFAAALPALRPPLIISPIAVPAAPAEPLRTNARGEGRSISESSDARRRLIVSTKLPEPERSRRGAIALRVSS
mmetsp:Transcript_1921/g.4489  ORF Transcript_1921/g.4489 Transcript_1921/m.4489 type:complete len:248 (-) Transcript_1921:345-1088(-)